MKTKWIVAALLVVVSFAASPAQGKKKYVPIRADYTFRTEVLAGIKDADIEAVLPRLMVIISNKEVSDSVIFEAPHPDATEFLGFGEVKEEDINFDGVPDLQVNLGPFNGWGNFTYEGFVWNQKEHKFDYVDEYSQIFEPYIDKQAKQIRGGLRVDNELNWDVWEWRNGKLTKVEEGVENLNYDE